MKTIVKIAIVLLSLSIIFLSGSIIATFIRPSKAVQDLSSADNDYSAKTVQCVDDVMNSMFVEEINYTITRPEFYRTSIIVSTDEGPVTVYMGVTDKMIKTNDKVNFQFNSFTATALIIIMFVVSATALLIVVSTEVPARQEQDY